MKRFEKMKKKIIRRFAVEMSAAAVILLTFLIFKNSTDILLGLAIIYVICLAVIYGFRSGT
ncbi:MAG: hypothetical protein R6V35_00095 [Candidatus Nanohaloarchaea archaeon]